MTNKSSFRRPFDKQHGRRAQELLKSASNHLDHIHWSLSSQLSWKKSLLLTCKSLVLLVNTLSADEKYPVLNRNDLTIPVQMQLPQKQKTSFKFLSSFLKSRLNFQYFETKVDPQRFCFSEFTDSENVVRKMSKKCRFRRPFDKQHGKRAKALSKSVSQQLYDIHWWLPSQLSWKRSLLMTCKILAQLVNSLAADEKYPVFSGDNFTIAIQMQ